jgi:hypothetical protein
VTVDDPPTLFFATKYGGYPKREWRDGLGTADLGSVALELDDVREVRGLVSRDALKSNRLALTIVSRSPFRRLDYRVRAASWRAEGIGERYVVALREQLQHRCGITLLKGIEGLVRTVDDLRKFGR